MSVVIKDLSQHEAERHAMEAQAEQIAGTPKPQVNVHNGREFVFVAHFDGTLNDKDHVPKGQRQTNVANLHELMEPHTKDHDNFVSHYYPGVGSKNSGLVRSWKASISPSGDMRSTTERAYRQFSSDASKWLREHPDADPATSLKVMATGFSRGGVTMAMFSQLLYERGLVAENGKTLVPPGVLGLSGGIVYDPVSKGYRGNAAFSPTSQNMTEVQATAEYRRWFKDVNHDADPNISTIEVIGNHGNIGGGHDDQGISARILEPSREWFSSAGVPLDALPKQMRYRADQAIPIYEERDLPGMTPLAKLTGNKLIRGAAVALAGGGIIKPVEMLAPRAVELLARKADYPTTHNPRNGLDAPRQQRPSARHQELMPDDWQRFEGVDGVVWSKHYPGANPQDGTRAVMVERNLPGRKNDRIDLYLVRGSGEIEQQQQFVPAGRAMQRMGAEGRQRIDQQYSQPLEQRLMQDSIQTREQHTGQALDRKVAQRLEHTLNQPKQDISADGQHHVQRSNSRQTTTVSHPHPETDQRKQMAQAFKTDPDAALEQYPSSTRVGAAKATLEAVSLRYAGSSRGISITRKMHTDLSNRLAQGTAIPNPQQAFGIIHRAMGRGGIGD